MYSFKSLLKKKSIALNNNFITLIKLSYHFHSVAILNIDDIIPPLCVESTQVFAVWGTIRHSLDVLREELHW